MYIALKSEYAIYGAFPDVQIANSAGTDGPPYHQRLLNRALVTSWMFSLLFSPEDTMSMFSKKNDKK